MAFSFDYNAFIFQCSLQCSIKSPEMHLSKSHSRFHLKLYSIQLIANKKVNKSFCSRQTKCVLYKIKIMKKLTKLSKVSKLK